jgi:hypothetical protein
MSRDRIKVSVQYRIIGIECMIVYSMEGSDIMYDSVQYGRVGI